MSAGSDVRTVAARLASNRPFHVGRSLTMTQTDTTTIQTVSSPSDRRTLAVDNPRTG